MAIKKMGKQTVKFENPPSIVSTYTIVGPKEGEGPLKDYFDTILEDDMWGQESFEKSEAKIQEETIKAAISEGKLSSSDIDYLLSGDLLNQIVSSTYIHFCYPSIGVVINEIEAGIEESTPIT